VDMFSSAAVLQPPARSTLRRVPTFDCEDTTDAGERGEISEGLESRPGAFGFQAVVAVGAGNVIERSRRIVINGVVANNVRRCDGKECRKRDEGRSKLHCDGVIRALGYALVVGDEIAAF